VALTVLMNAGPWLPVPPGGYGGIENVITTLVPELRRRGVRVVLCATAGSSLEVDRLVETVPAPRFAHVARPYNQVSGIAHAHMAAVVRELRSDPGIGLVHDHLEVVGPAVLGAMGHAAPPVLQTLHWDLGKHADFYSTFDGAGRIFFAGVSDPQVARAPAALRAQVLGSVPLAVDLASHPFVAHKGERFLTLARFTEAKGQDAAARACRAVGAGLDMAGPVAGAADAAALERGLADPTGALDGHPDVEWYLRAVRPLEDGAQVRWIGSLTGAAKLKALGEARALLCPVRWEEPGATAVVEAMACGTPVIGLRRGVLPSLVEEGRTGFLADHEDELPSLLRRAGELHPRACRAAAEERFTAGRMAERYLALYEEVIGRATG